ncbi:hypothetical protein EV127DRAFT_412405 [Xylaria flabelliformis]|nr:hypothetical protein EV127DRAFT_412405 [Xylaria flabelliformis]
MPKSTKAAAGKTPTHKGKNVKGRPKPLATSVQDNNNDSGVDDNNSDNEDSDDTQDTDSEVDDHEFLERDDAGDELDVLQEYDDMEEEEEMEQGEGQDSSNSQDEDGDDDAAMDDELSNGLEEEPIILTDDDMVAIQISLTNRISRRTHDSPTLDSLPKSAMLVYAVNGLGKWGFGFTKVMKTLYPEAHKAYKAHCKTFKADGNKFPDNGYSGKCLIIPGDAKDSENLIWHVCLFTSYGYGRAGSGGKPGKDSEMIIKRQTYDALQDFREKLRNGSDGLRGHPLWTPSGQYMHIICPQFNSGAFKIPWIYTKVDIVKLFKDWSGKWSLLREDK